MTKLNPLTKTEKAEIKDLANVQYAISKHYGYDPVKSAFWKGRSVGMGKIAQSYNPLVKGITNPGWAGTHFTGNPVCPFCRIHTELIPEWHKYFSPAKQRVTKQKLFRCSRCDSLLQLYGGKLYKVEMSPAIKPLLGIGKRYNPEKYEIEVNKRWVEVDKSIFRSWSSKRKLNGKIYHGPVYYLDTRKISHRTNLNPHWLKEYAKQHGGTYTREVLSNGFILHRATVPGTLESNPIFETIGTAAITGIGLGIGFKSVDLATRKMMRRRNPDMTIYCVKCRKKVVPMNVVVVGLAKGRSKVAMKAYRGVCPHCHSRIYRIIGRA